MTKKAHPPLDAAVIRRRALSAAKRLKIKDHFIGVSADDIAQEVVLAFLINKDDHGTVDQRTISKIRQHIGDLRFPKEAEIKKQIERAYIEVGYLLDVEAPNKNIQLDFDAYLKSLRRVERAIIFLFFYWGFTLKEIGNVLGYTDGRISQIMTATLKKLKEKVKSGKL